MVSDEIMLNANSVYTYGSDKFRGVYYLPLFDIRLLSGNSNPDICCYRL